MTCLVALVLPRAAYAEDGSWTPGWAACDQSGNPLTGTESPYFTWGNSNYNLTGIPTGSASGYEALASYALSQPFWGLFDAYFPNRRPDDLSASWFYGATAPLMAGLGISAKAQNFAQLSTYNYVFSYGNDSSPITGNVQAQAANTLTGTFKWGPTWQGMDDDGNFHYYDPLSPDPYDPFVPADPEPTAPDHVNLLVSTSLSVSAGIRWNVNMGNPQAPIPGGWSASASATLGQDSIGVSAPAQVTGQSLTTRRLMQIGANGGTATITLPALEQTTANNTVPAPFLGGGQAAVISDADVGATAAVDERALTISASVDPTYYKEYEGANETDENGDPIVSRMLHVPDPDGTMKGDIGIGYGDGNDNNRTNYTSITYHANPTPLDNWNFDGAQYLWNSSLKGASDNGTLPTPLGSYDIPAFSNLYRDADSLDVNGSGGPPLVIPQDTQKTDHIYLKFTDGSDGAVATANYYMTLHEPDEFTPSHKPTDFIYDDIDPSADSPGYAIYGGGINCTWNTPGVYWGYAGNALSVLSSVPWPVPWIGLLMSVLGVGANQVGNIGDHGVANFGDVAWNDPESTFSPGYPRGSQPEIFYHMYPRLHILYTEKYALQDHYDLGGYEGTTLAATETYQGAASWFGDFVYYLN